MTLRAPAQQENSVTNLADQITSIRGQVARRVTPVHPDLDDLVQEALIAWWQTEERRPDMAPGYYARAAIHAAVDAVSGTRQPFGERHHQRSGRTNHYRPDTSAVDWSDEANRVLDPAAADPMEHVMLAYHHGEIAQALAELPPEDREAVVERFWGGKTWPEIEKDRGARHGSLSGRWAQSIRPKLRRHLHHLVDAA